MVEASQRWLAQLQTSIPAMDMLDVVGARDSSIRVNRQNMPEIA